MTLMATNGGTVRELIAELAQIEDAVRRIPTFCPVDTGGVPPLNPELLQLLDRERQVLAALRAVDAARDRLATTAQEM